MLETLKKVFNDVTNTEKDEFHICLKRIDELMQHENGGKNSLKFERECNKNIRAIFIDTPWLYNFKQLINKFGTYDVNSKQLSDIKLLITNLEINYNIPSNETNLDNDTLQEISSSLDVIGERSTKCILEDAVEN